MKAIIVEADGTAPYVKDIDQDLAAYQEIVGGLIEPVPSHDPKIDETVVVYANEEGLILNLPINRNLHAIQTLRLWQATIAGNLLILGVNGPDETDAPQEIIDLLVGPSARA